jgi:hypothetical protein
MAVSFTTQLVSSDENVRQEAVPLSSPREMADVRKAFSPLSGEGGCASVLSITAGAASVSSRAFICKRMDAWLRCR